MNQLVKFFTDEDGCALSEEQQIWHFIEAPSDAPRSLCQGQAFGAGESTVEFEIKEVKRGGVQCEDCLLMLKYYKSIKL